MRPVTIIYWTIEKVSKTPTQRKSSAKKEAFAAMYKAGKTYAEIAAIHGVSRQYIQQSLNSLGVSADQGGASLRKARKENAHQRQARLLRAKESRCLLKHGISLSQVEMHKESGLWAAWKQQKRGAFYRGIEWDLTFKQWLDIWQESGKLGERGLGKDLYCMARNHDIGPYAVGNVSIKTVRQNSQEAFSKTRSEGKITGVFNLYPRTTRPWFAKYSKHTIGRFATQEEAAKARAEYMNQEKQSNDSKM